MKESMIALLVLAFSLTIATAAENPLLKEFKTPFGVPPFSKIKNEHYLPAIQEGIRQHKLEIAAIAENPEPPTFANTIDALELSGQLLTRVTGVFDNMTSALTSEPLQQIAKEAAPLRSAHADDIRLNTPLFKRIKALYDTRERLGLTPEQTMVLTLYYRDFVRGGANLEETRKAELRAINQELALLELQFGDNVLKETNDYALTIAAPRDLAGLPPAVIAAGAEAAAERGQTGQWVFTLQAPSIFPFLQYTENRELRRQIYTAYIHRGDNNNSADNKAILSKIAALRVRRANLLGYPSHADYILEENMAKKPENVYALLEQLWRPAQKRARQEAADMQAIIDQEEGGFQLQPWDWWYYAEKVKKNRYDLDEEALRPYFKLENVRSGVFSVAQKLYGITFSERKDVPVYHPDVRAFEVKEADGRAVGILMVDYFPRASKRGGAWMSEYRLQQKLGGIQRPVICNVGNFSKPTADTPALLSMDEVETMFHEFGHALHGLLSDCTYPRVAGTSVARDFVELPSQIMENWAFEPEVLKSYARHYQTGAPIPEDLIGKIERSGRFNQGFATVEYLAASFLDMDWHTPREPIEHDAILFEQQSMARIGLLPEIASRYRSPYFRHIFSGGYSSGYYAYIWAEVLDADAFQAFKETTLFDQKTAAAFRKYILAAGGSEEPMILYQKFRGREPGIEPLLKKRGLTGE
ncbi:MAG TPA: M3 family metallopeptidase [bacterium]|nr:M3 family metallopeptidase [bacterium]